MNTSRYARRVLGSLLIVCGGGIALPTPAKAECIYARAEVYRWQEPTWTILSPDDCVTDTPLPTAGRFSQGHRVGDPPGPLQQPGTPHGWEVGLTFPVP